MRVYIVFLILFISASVQFVSAAEPSPLFDLSGAPAEVEPEIDRRIIKIPDIDSENIEIGLFGGVLSVENFGANYLKGINVSIHLSEDFFLSLNAGSSQIEDQVYRRLNLPLFGEGGKRDVIDYNLLLGWNAFPGEIYFGKNNVFTSEIYFLAGAGSIRFDKDEYSSTILGMGVKVLPKDWLVIRFESKVSEYRSTLLGYGKYNHNVDILTGISIFF